MVALLRELMCFEPDLWALNARKLLRRSCFEAFVSRVLFSKVLAPCLAACRIEIRALASRAARPASKHSPPRPATPRPPPSRRAREGKRVGSRTRGKLRPLPSLQFVGPSRHPLDRGREGVTLPALRTVRAVFPHTALQLVVSS